MRPHPTAHSQSVPLPLILILLMAACVAAPGTPPVLQPQEAPTEVPPTPRVTAVALPGWLAIHFTNSSAPGAADYQGGPDEQLAAAIDGARLSIDMAAYSLNLWSIRDALLRAERRGVVIRMVMESDNMDEPEVQALIDAGIPVLGDQREGLMHDKFVVIDRSEVWTGSMNYTVGGGYYDDNNLVRIRSVQAAENYTAEFDEMFVEHLFGQDVLAATPHPRLTIDGTPVEIYFSPDDGVAARILELLQGAQESIYFMAFSFTSDELAQALLERAGAGITVAGAMDDSQVASNEGTEYDPFLQAGLDVRLDGEDGLMHHKVIIIDGRIVITGSYNFTASAEEYNDENVVIIFSEAAAVEFLREFERVHQRMQR